MILNKFRDKSIKKKIDKELIDPDKTLISISDEKISSILILDDGNSTNYSSEIIAKELNIDVSNIKTINYIKKQKKDSEAEEFLTDKDFNLFGKIKSERAQNIVDTEFDLLINLSENNLFLYYLVLLSNARFKVGFSSSDNRLYNFMVDIDTEDITVFSKELKKYLEILNKL